mgnify:CR=1 FL=1
MRRDRERSDDQDHPILIVLQAVRQPTMASGLWLLMPQCGAEVGCRRWLTGSPPLPRVPDTVMAGACRTEFKRKKVSNRRRDKPRQSPRCLSGRGASATTSSGHVGAAAPRLVTIFAPDEEDVLYGAPNLDSRIPIAQPIATHGWTVFQIPSSPGVQLRARAVSRRGLPERKSTQAVHSFRCRRYLRLIHCRIPAGRECSLQQARAASNHHGRSWWRVQCARRRE